MEAEVSQGIAEGGHFPVNDGSYGRGVSVRKDRVVDAEVAVDYRRTALRGALFGEPGVERGHVVQLSGPDAVPLVVPAANLPSEVTFRSAEPGEPDASRID